MATDTYVGTLYVTECPSCFVTHGIPAVMRERMIKHGGDAYCPNGHAWQFMGASLATQLERAKSRATHLEDQRDAAEASARSYKGHVTRIKNRVRNGVCPFCNRSFGDVRAHMATVHPEKD